METLFNKENMNQLINAIILMAQYNIDKQNAIKNKVYLNNILPKINIHSTKWITKKQWLYKNEYWLVFEEPFFSLPEIRSWIDSQKPDNRHPKVIEAEKNWKEIYDKYQVYPSEALHFELEQRKIIFENIAEQWTPRIGKKIEVFRSTQGSKKGDVGIVVFERLRYVKHPHVGMFLSHKVLFTNQDGLTCYTTANSSRVIDHTTCTHPQTYKLMNATLHQTGHKWYYVMIEGNKYYAPKSQTKRISDNLWMFPVWFLVKKGIIPDENGVYHKDEIKKKVVVSYEDDIKL